jgi:hypothetical protein
LLNFFPEFAHPNSRENVAASFSVVRSTKREKHSKGKMEIFNSFAAHDGILLALLINPQDSNEASSRKDCLQNNCERSCKLG